MIINFKNIKFLKIFLDEFGKIKRRKKIKLSLYKKIIKSIKIARFLSLLPYNDK
ncbi:30S ribosomal protein S18 [Candidatus Vidania fulgoroideorum]